MFKTSLKLFTLTLILIILFGQRLLNAQTLSGYIYDVQQRPLPGANIYIDNTNRGTISNSEGFYILKLQPGLNQVVFSFIGYKNDTLEVIGLPDRDDRKNIYLQESLLEGEAILVFAEQYNDAQQIVWKTIQNKLDYLSGIKNYEYDAYQKTVFQLDVTGGQRIIGGLIETHSRGYFKSPDNFQEVVLAKRQSANFSNLTNIFTVGKLPNLLEETIKIDELNIISPLSKKALDYYHFEMIDTTVYERRYVFNMTFSPKLRGLPLFSGKMSIIDRDFAVIFCELEGQDRIVTQIRRQISISQRFRQYEGTFWFPTEMLMTSLVDMNIPGIPVLYWKQHGLISNYRINLENYDHRFDQNILTYQLLSEKEREELWQKGQLVPLNTEEEQALRHIDSVITHANPLKKSIIYLLQNFDNILVTGLYDFYHFNRVEGNFWGLGFDSKRKLDDQRLRISLGYGQEDQRWKYRFWWRRDFFSGRLSLTSQAYDRLAFLDQFYRYNWSDITWQTLAAKNDYADYFYENGFKVGLDYKPFKYLSLGMQYGRDRHRSAENNITWHPFGLDKSYRTAVPVDEGQINTVEFNLVSDNLKYFDLGWILSPDLSQDFFDLNFNMMLSSREYLGSDYQFERYHLFINSFKQLPPYIHFYLRLSGGYLSKDKPVQHYFHLVGSYGSFGNPILFRTITRDEFIGDRYLAVSLENNFKNTIYSLLHLPFLKNSKLEFLVFSNLGWIRNEGLNRSELASFNQIKITDEPLTEIGLAVGNIFTFFRLDFTWRTNYKQGDDFNIKLTSRLFIR
jgi:hypothetical protein